MRQNEICNFEICFETLFEILKLWNLFFFLLNRAFTASLSVSEAFSCL